MRLARDPKVTQMTRLGFPNAKIRRHEELYSQTNLLAEQLDYEDKKALPPLG